MSLTLKKTRANKSKVKTLVAYAIYMVAFTCLLPFLPLRLLWRARKAPAYGERKSERFGVNTLSVSPRGIWVHAVSVGEVIAAIPIIEQLEKRYPDKSITVTTSTPTGSERLLSAFGNRVNHVYAPYDWPLFVGLFLRKLQPAMVIVIETELWPVTLLMCRRRAVPVLVANARLSEKSASGYRRISWLARAMLKNVWIAAQTAEDARRFVGIGADDARIFVTGSVKFDLAITASQRQQGADIRATFERAGKQFVWVAASTHAGEEEIVLSAHQQLLQHHPDVLLVLVPRHPERFDDVADLVEQAAMNCTRSSSQRDLDSASSVYLVDAMGELMPCYGACDCAFVGGSLVPAGGHNYLEPAAWAVPVISGPYRHNFAHIANMLEKAQALQTASNASELAILLDRAIQNSEERVLAGKAAQTAVNINRGAGEQLQSIVARVLSANP